MTIQGFSERRTSNGKNKYGVLRCASVEITIQGLLKRGTSNRKNKYGGSSLRSE
jgi:hypothetical protein